MGISYEILERGGCECLPHSRIIDPRSAGKLLFCHWVARKAGEKIVHRDTIVALREQCVGDDVPLALREALTHDLFREHMVSGIVWSGFASHIDYGRDGLLYVAIHSIQAEHLFRMIESEYPDEGKWIHEHVVVT